MISLVLAAALLAAGDPPASAPPPAAKTEKPSKDNLICKREAVLGSRMPRKVCLTPEEWDQRQQRGADALGQAQRSQPSPGN